MGDLGREDGEEEQQQEKQVTTGEPEPAEARFYSAAAAWAGGKTGETPSREAFTTHESFRLLHLLNERKIFTFQMNTHATIYAC